MGDVDNVDVYPLLARLIGVAPLPNDGDATRFDDVLMEPNRARKTPQFVADSIGAKLVVCPGLVGGAPEAKTCLDLIDYDLRALVKAVQP